MLKPPSEVGRARISWVVSGALLSQKKLYMVCAISDIAHEGIVLDVAVYQRVDVSNPLITRAFPL